MSKKNNDAQEWLASMAVEANGPSSVGNLPAGREVTKERVQFILDNYVEEIEGHHGVQEDWRDKTNEALALLGYTSLPLSVSQIWAPIDPEFGFCEHCGMGRYSDGSGCGC